MTAPARLGKYDLVARIAKGGMAEIYLARQTGAASFSRLVVIKRILPHLAEEPHFVRMFLEEARLAALIAHPNVVQIFDVDQYEGHYYIAMEYIEGPSLGMVMRKLRRSSGALPHLVAAEVIAQSCDGLHAAHELRDDRGQPLELVHRDVSPHNLMITEGGVVKLVDFGIAKAHGSAVQTRTGSVKGKYPYMSPEQCRGEQLDRRADIFSLGIVFFELLTGRRIFQRQTDLMTLKAITEDPVPDPREMRPEVPEKITAIVQRCLQRKAEDRFTTAAETGRAVRAAMAELGQASSTTLLASYITNEHRELLKSRAEALQQALELQPPAGPVPVVEGFGSSGSASSSTASALPKQQASGMITAARRPRALLWPILAAVLVLLAAAGGLLYRYLGPGRRVSGPALRLAMPPSFPAEVAGKEMKPLLRYLEKRLHRPVQLVIPPDYRSLRSGLLDGSFHVAILPPLEFVLARRQNRNIKALVTNLYEGSRTYQAMLITRDEAGITSPPQLRGKRMCYVDPESTSGFLLPRAYLRAQGLDPEHLFKQARFSRNHLQVIRDILSGMCDAGAIYSGGIVNATQQGLPTSRIRILAITGQLPYDVICAAPDLPDALWKDVNRVLLDLDPKQEWGTAFVGPTFRISGFAVSRIEEFEMVERAARSEGLFR